MLSLLFWRGEYFNLIVVYFYLICYYREKLEC